VPKKGTRKWEERKELNEKQGNPLIREERMKRNEMIDGMEWHEMKGSD
jgi:hypothetical protein